MGGGRPRFGTAGGRVKRRDRVARVVDVGIGRVGNRPADSQPPRVVGGCGDDVLVGPVDFQEGRVTLHGPTTIAYHFGDWKLMTCQGSRFPCYRDRRDLP